MAAERIEGYKPAASNLYAKGLKVNSRFTINLVQ
jgi:hypothetical protein